MSSWVSGTLALAFAEASNRGAHWRAAIAHGMNPLKTNANVLTRLSDEAFRIPTKCCKVTPAQRQREAPIPMNRIEMPADLGTRWKLHVERRARRLPHKLQRRIRRLRLSSW